VKNEYEITPVGRLNAGFAELWKAREMCFFFAWRDIKVRYKQTVLGIAWVVIQPLLMMTAFTLLIGRYGSSESHLPYMTYAFSGLIIYNLFSSGFSSAGNSMLSNSSIIRKIYFPRLIIPVASVMVSLIDLLFTLPFLAAMVIWKQSDIHWLYLAYMIPGILLAFITACGAGILISALNIKYRDVRYVIPFLSQFLLFSTPAVYPAGMITKPWISTLIELNPLTGAIHCFRAFLTGTTPDPIHLLLCTVISLVIFFIGIFYFRRTERYFADII
jgi:lipopolysaccharide transport system permease protein